MALRTGIIAALVAFLSLTAAETRAQWPAAGRAFDSRLPLCRQPVVRRSKVYHHTPGSDSLDVLYFDFGDTQQVRRAKKYPHRAIPYLDAAGSNRSESAGDFWQSFARVVRVKCLPTRFRFSYVGSQRYLEYRTGAAAWED